MNETARIIQYKNDGQSMVEFARSSGLADAEHAREVHVRLAPIVIDAMAKTFESAAGTETLVTAARGLTWVERDAPELLFKNSDVSFRRGLGKIIFGESLPSLVSSIASAEDISVSNAAITLEVITAVALSVMAGDANSQINGETLAATVESNAASAPGPAYAAPVSGATAHSALPPAAPVFAPTPAATPQPEDDRSKKTGMFVGAAVGIVAILGVGFAVVSGGSDEAATEQLETVDVTVDQAPLADDDAASGDPVEPTPPTVAETPETTVEAAVEPEAPETTIVDVDTDAEDAALDVEPAGAVSGSIVSLSIPMTDIVTPERDASGVLNFDFNTESGEVCYSVESNNIAGPYRSHIHVGGSDDKGGIVVDLGLLDSGEVGCVANLPIDTQAILDGRAGHYAELHDVSEEWTIRGQLSDAVDPEIVSLSVPMVDIEGTTPDATGVLNFDFNTVTGQVCYSVESTVIQGPYRSHIHVGDAGVKGGIVVELGLLESGATNCVDNLPVDTNAVLADRSGHYAELHDISEEWTIRGQLSESVDLDDEPSDADLQVDADGGGASIVLSAGTIFLQGAVADQATADELFGSLSDVGAATPVVNELTVEAGAPLPSGRVVIADAVFFDVSSDEVKEIDERTLAAITALALSRDDWTLTVVGHTDSDGSDVANLELSLRRATALRDLLATQGVPDENLRIRGAGATAPVGDNATAAGRAQNRRIEFEFTPNS